MSARDVIARLAEAEREITRFQQERERWINYTIDLQRIIEALCEKRGMVEPKSTARHHYQMAKDYLASKHRFDTKTVEKCAEIALSHVNQTDYDIEPEAAVAENVTAKSIATAIRALKEKQP